MKKKLLLKHLFLLFALIVGSGTVWAEEPELTLDFTSAWTAGDDTSDGEKVFTTTVGGTTYTITGNGNTNFKFNSGYFFFGKSGAYVNLPIVDFDVKKIEVVGKSGASGDVKHNIFVGDAAVSTEVKGLNGTTSTFEIASGYQTAGTQYVLMVTSSHNAQVTYIKYYKKTSGGDEPTTFTITFDSGEGTFVGNTDFPNESNTKEAGTYTLPSATPASGYTFDGWVTTDNETPQTGSYTVSGDVDFTAHYTQNSSDPNPTYTHNFAGADNFYTDANLSTHPSYGSGNNVSTIYYGDGSKFVASGASSYFSAASSGYFMLGKSGAKIDLPKFEGYKIKQVKLHSSNSHSTSVAVSIVSGSNTASAAQTWSTKDKDYVYDIASDYQSSALSVLVTNGYNTQFTSITIVCEEDVPSTDPQIVVNSTTINLAYDATSGEIPFEIVNPVPGNAIGAGVFDAPWITNVDYENVSGNEYKVTFNTTANEGAERTATITITYGTLTKDVTVTQAAAPVVYTTIPALFEAATSSGVNVNVTFGNWVVSGVTSDGKTAYVTDNEGNGFIIYKSNNGFAVNDKLSGTVMGTPLKLFSGSAEFTDLTATTNGLTVSNDGEITVITDKAIADLAGVNSGSVITLNNLTYDGTNLSDGTNTIKPYSTLFSGTFESGKTYNVTGVYLQYNTTKEILPRSEADIVEVAIPTHNVTFSINGNEREVEFEEGSAITFPANPQDILGMSFVGWITTTIAGTTNTAPEFVTSATMGTNDMTFYAVFADASGSAPSLTKMSSSDTFTDNDKIVIVAYDSYDEKDYALYQETQNTSWVGKYEFDGEASTVAADNKNWLTVTADGDNWILGDDTNGYLYTSGSNNLILDTSNSSSFTLAYSTGNGFTLKCGSRWLALRNDVETNKFRLGGTGASPLGVGYFDIYKFIPGELSYSNYCTTIPTTVPATITEHKWATFSSDKDLEFGALWNGLQVYIVRGADGSTILIEQVYNAKAGTGLLLYSKTAGTYEIPIAPSAQDYSNTNKLIAVTEDNTIINRADDGTTNYVLTVKDEKAVFAYINSTPAVLRKGQAYLNLDGAPSAPYLGFDGEGTTGIMSLTPALSQGEGACYDLSGRCVENPSKGVYIVNGRKVVVK